MGFFFVIPQNRHALLENRKTQDIANSYHLNIDLELHCWAMVMVIMFSSSSPGQICLALAIQNVFCCHSATVPCDCLNNRS